MATKNLSMEIEINGKEYLFNVEVMKDDYSYIAEVDMHHPYYSPNSYCLDSLKDLRKILYREALEIYNMEVEEMIEN